MPKFDVSHCSSLLIVYEGANPAIRRRLVSRENSMCPSEAAVSADTERIEDDEDIQGMKRTSCWTFNQLYCILHVQDHDKHAEKSESLSGANHETLPTCPNPPTDA